MKISKCSIIVALSLLSVSAFADLAGKQTFVVANGELTTHKNQANGYAGLDAGTKLSNSQLPAAPSFSGTVTAAALAVTGTTTPTGRVVLPIGQVGYFNTTGTLTTIASASDGTTNLVALAPTTTATIDTGFDNGGSNNGALRYTGATTKYADIAVTASGTPATDNEVFVFAIAKNGTAIDGCQVLGTLIGTRPVALHCVTTLAQNDVITLKAGNTTAGHDLTVKSLNIQALLM